MNGNPTMQVRANRPRSVGLSVILAGLVTSAITLGIVYALSRADISVMGFYLMPYIPVGAILAGLGAGSGYVLATWFKSIKVNAPVLAMVVILQLSSYFAAQYIDYVQVARQYEDGTPVGFWEYFDYTTRSFTFKEEHKKESGPLGAWGYAIRLLEIAGFALGGLIGAFILRASPYCDACGLYMKRRRLGPWPASVPARKVSKRDAQAQEQYAAEQEAALAKAQAMMKAVIQAGADGDVQQFNQALGELPSITGKQTMKLPTHFKGQIVYCRNCAHGRLVFHSAVRSGNQFKSKEISRHELEPGFVAELESLPGAEHIEGPPQDGG